MTRLTRRALGAAALGGIAAAAPGSARRAHAAPTVRVGSLQFGTVMWELDTIRRHELDQAEGFTLEIKTFGGNDGADVALMGEAVDAIVEDWLWVGRQRAAGAMLTFIPYSSSVGGVMARQGGPVASLADLAGKKLGVAGGPLDKSWIILQTYGRKQGIDLATQAQPVFAAPPLLNEKVKSGELDAVLNYWNWCARLESAGFVEIARMADAIEALGVPATTPQLGYVVREAWAEGAPELARGFAAASRAAKALLASSDAEWERLRPLTRAEDDRTLAAFRDRWRAGVLRHWGAAERADATRLFALLAESGGERLVGRATVLPEGTFWQGVAF